MVSSARANENATITMTSTEEEDLLHP
ncbi:hypothetical protein A2U01_0071530, partial [Trifolium medium]|nr:hypothetical protein [Trifolium medium]